jgi:hypothetical protein
MDHLYLHKRETAGKSTTHQKKETVWKSVQNHMGYLLYECALLDNAASFPSGAQTERRVAAGPAGGLLGGKDRTGPLLLGRQESVYYCFFSGR